MSLIHSAPALSQELIHQLSLCSVATVHEALGKIGALDAGIKPLERTMKLCGRAVTVKCHPGDNLMLIKAASLLQEGDVLVMDAGEYTSFGPFGEVLAVECLAKGAHGLVTSGSVRDTEAIIRRGFPVFCRGISVRGTAKGSLGEINVPVCVGGIIVNPGDAVLGDADGVVVVPHDRVQEAITASNAREEKERHVMERLQNGESLFDIYGYQQTFERLGCKE